MTLEEALAVVTTELPKLKQVHEELLIAIEDFVNSALSEGAQKRLKAALDNSRKFVNND